MSVSCWLSVQDGGMEGGCFDWCYIWLPLPLRTINVDQQS
ncbi:unnamed protein product [Callosobruchus maculatus]|uniref:Uncharacterized protein n=1 Tax=Callosobruchus maculatus TaxID=64391 RepID=A0A653CTY0_CALMS|nr:unnamed protein product [Callosobruchus maculatus]